MNIKNKMVLTEQRNKELKELEKEDWTEKDSLTGRKMRSKLNKKNISKFEMDEMFLEYN